jgi:hypothetical protein
VRTAASVASALFVSFVFLAACTCARTAERNGGVFDEAPAACANLKALGCAEGASAYCVPALTNAATANHTTTPALQCSVTASSKAAVRGCDPNYFACP